MSHTNISVPNRFTSRAEEKELVIILLKAELEYFKKEYEALREELSNIPEAIEEYGYVDLYNQIDKVQMKLVKRKAG